MNERALEILNLLIRRPEYKVSDLEQVLHLTRRQINYSISQINDSLEVKGLPKISRTKAGDIMVPMEVVQSIALKDEEKLDSLSYFSDTERMDYLLLFLMISKEDVSLVHIMDFLRVSKNTALADIKAANHYAKRYYIQIVYSRTEGYLLKGEELQIRVLLNDLINRRMKLAKAFPFSDYFTVGRDEVIHYIRSVERMIQINYSDESFDFMIEALLFNMTRITTGKIEEKSFFRNKVNETFEYQVVAKLLPDNWIVSTDDVEWLTLLFLSSNTYQNRIERVNTDPKLQQMIHKMVQDFQTQTLVEIDEREIFEKRLYDHLRPACFRIKYGIKLDGFGLQTMMYGNTHSILIELMKELILPLEQTLGKKFPTNELELLSFYFGHQLSQMEKVITQKKRAVIVCTNGLIVSKMMMESLKKLFPELHFLAAFSVREFEEFASDYEVVFTTVLLNTEILQYIINPLMEYEEQISLRYRVLRELGISEWEQFIDKIIHIVSNHTVIKNEASLKQELEHFLVRSKEDDFQTDSSQMPFLKDYVKPGYIQIIEEKLTWREALTLAVQPLVEQGVVSILYTEKLLEQTADKNDYSFLGTTMAIPHTNLIEETYGEGISLLICKEPIDYPNGQKIYLIAPLAITDLTRHLRAINQLADLAGDEESIQKLLQSKLAEEAYKIIEELG